MRSVSGEGAQVKAGEREGGSRVMNLALGGWWRLCHRVQLKHLEQPVHRLHLVHHLTVYHLTVYCKCTLCLLALLSQLCVCCCIFYALNKLRKGTLCNVHVVMLRTALPQTFIETAWIIWQINIPLRCLKLNKKFYEDLFCSL